MPPLSSPEPQHHAPCPRCGEPVSDDDVAEVHSILGDVERGHRSCLTGVITRRDMHAMNAVKRDGGWYFRCDAFGCEETHPLDHESVGEECFGFGRWLGWMYLDLNRPDLMTRQLRFCSVTCLQWWLERERINESRRPVTSIDRALRRPFDELARRTAVNDLEALRG